MTADPAPDPRAVKLAAHFGEASPGVRVEWAVAEIAAVQSAGLLVLDPASVSRGIKDRGACSYARTVLAVLAAPGAE